MFELLSPHKVSGDDRELKRNTSLNKSWGGEKKKWEQYLFFILSCVNNKTLAPTEIIHVAVCTASSPDTIGRIWAGISHTLMAFSSSLWHEIVWVWHQADVSGVIAAGL